MGSRPEVVVVPVPAAEPERGDGVPAAPPEVTRLSESPLWDLQRRFFADAGVDAWRSGEVPDYITTNAYIADAFAATVLAHLHDLDAAGEIDHRAPVHVIELGAGPGRFAHAFSAALGERLTASSLASLDVVHVMTDFSERTIAAWREQPALSAAVERGGLDFACFDLTDPGPLRLERSGVTLAAGTVVNPVVLIANYVFDAIPQDCFAVRSGQLKESLARFELPAATPRPGDAGPSPAWR